MRTLVICVLVTFLLTACNNQSLKNLLQEHNQQINEEVEKKKQVGDPH
jgi:uncharacterized protein YcfL